MPAPTKLNQASAMLGQPKPPPGMTAGEKANWDAVVTSRPASAWTPSDGMLVKLYVSAIADVERLDREIDRNGETVGSKVNPLVRVRAARENLVLSLGMKLKLFPSNRYDGRTVHRLGQHAAKGSAALATMDVDVDDLLGGIPVRKGRMQ